MKLLNSPISLSVIFLFVLSTGCASKSVKTEPTEIEPVAAAPAPVAAPLVSPEPESIQVVEAKPKPLPPSQQRTVYFEYNSGELSSESQDIVATHVAFLLKNSTFQITIEGHADDRGSDDYNQQLGSLRAQAIKAALLTQGVDDSQINLVSFGENKPAVMGNNDDAWQSNRRAILVYSYEELAAQANTANKLLASDQ